MVKSSFSSLAFLYIAMSKNMQTIAVDVTLEANIQKTNKTDGKRVS